MLSDRAAEHLVGQQALAHVASKGHCSHSVERSSLVVSNNLTLLIRRRVRRATRAPNTGPPIPGELLFTYPAADHAKRVPKVGASRPGRRRRRRLDRSSSIGDADEESSDERNHEDHVRDIDDRRRLYRDWIVATRRGGLACGRSQAAWKTSQRGAMASSRVKFSRRWDAILELTEAGAALQLLAPA